jgi:hypothetical protein
MSAAHEFDLQHKSLDVGKRGALWKLLDRIEQYLLRMIFGIFKFSLYHLPKYIWDTLTNWFPTIMKFVKVVLLLCFWIAVVIGPLSYLYYKIFGITPHPIDIETEYRAIVDTYGIWPIAWAIVAIIGSFWGLIYIKRITWTWWQRRAKRKLRTEMSTPDKEAIVN